MHYELFATSADSAEVQQWLEYMNENLGLIGDENDIQPYQCFGALVSPPSPM